MSPINFINPKSLSFAVLLSLTSSFATANQKVATVETVTQIPRVNGNIESDGDLTEPAWKSAKKFYINNVTFPQENVPAPVKTEAYMMEDGEVLYVGFIAYDSNPEQIRAFLSDRDSNWNDDLVGLKIDSFNDDTLAYQFFINPLGTQTDSIENVLTGRESTSWNGIWDSAGQINDEGYVVEIAIPLRILNFNDRLAEQTWGFELIRFLPRDEKLRISNTYMDQGNNCWVCQMSSIQGFKGAKQGANVNIVPTFVSGYSESRDVSANGDWNGDSTTDIGLDVKWGITPDMTLNATLNPDFSQVEADSGQLNVNNTFALFTPERRSFFLANEDYFSTPVNLIYTRNVQDPDYGAKLTGKVDEHAFGAFVANDQTALFLLPGNMGSNVYEIDQETTNGAFRYNYVPSDTFSIGTTATLRDNADYHNYLTSIDSKYKPTENDRFDVQIMVSETSLASEHVTEIRDSGSYSDEQAARANDINGSDMAFKVRYEHNSRDWFFNTEHFNVGRAFRADLAFFNNSDIQKTRFSGGRLWRSDSDSWWTRIRLSSDVDWVYTQDNELLGSDKNIFLNINGPKQSFIRNGIVARTRMIDRDESKGLHVEGNSTEFNTLELRSWMEFKPTSNLWVGNFFKIGEGVDYANARLSDVLAFEPRFRWNINRHAMANVSYKYSKMTYAGEEVFTANLIDFRVSYQFSLRSFLRLSLVASDIHRNLENYEEDVRDYYDENTKSFSSQLLFSYKVNPQTLFFVGYSDGGYQNDELEKITKNQRSVFLKMSYAWML